jgi:adenylosuccinate lyase
MRSWEEQVPFRQLLENDREIASLLTAEEIESCFDPQKHLRFVPYIYERLGLFQEKS